MLARRSVVPPSGTTLAYVVVGRLDRGKQITTTYPKGNSMTASKATLVLIGLALSGVAAAQDAAVSTTKTSAMPAAIANSYGSLNLRHGTGEKLSADGSTNIIPYVLITPTLGTKLFGDKLDASVSMQFRKLADSVRISKVAAYAELAYTLLDNENVGLSTYTYIGQANGSSFGEVDVGPHLDLMTSVTTPIGKLAFSGFVEPLAAFNSGHSAPKIAVADRTTKDPQVALLTEDSKPAPTPDAETEARTPSYYSTTEVATKLSLDAVKGLAFGAGIDYFQNWAPKYAATATDTGFSYQQDGYSTKSAVMNKVSVSYKLSDAVTVANQVRLMVNGLYTDSYVKDLAVSGITSRLENRLTLNVTLF